MYDRWLARALVTGTAATVLRLAASTSAQAPPPAPTFTRDVAPILWSRCGECHRPNGVAPFSLLTYADARQRAQQIADVVARGIMPPWMPDNSVHFERERRLSAVERDRLVRWATTGRAEGDATRLPPTPAWPDGWRVGAPDLVIDLPEYVVPPTDTTDVFRNFVVEVPTDAVRYVRGLEFLPGNTSVHHANIYVDDTATSRSLDAADPQPGYAGLIPHSAYFPDGHFLGWTPGQAAPLEPEALAWTLPPRASLLVQLHLRATGKPERIRPRLGLYFSARPPSDRGVMLRLGTQTIDIPAGVAGYRAIDTFVLPVDTVVHAAQAHSHYRATSVHGEAVLPDGRRTPLLTIPQWNFNWQDTYRYQTPLALPKGTRLELTYLFDNSAANTQNPTRPPARAVWGFRSADEMGDLWLQLTAAPADRDALERAAQRKMTTETIAGYETQIAVNPDYAPIRNDVAVLYMETGRPDAAIPHFTRVAELEPTSAAARFNLARALQARERLGEALAAYRDALRLDPTYARARTGMAETLYLRAATEDAQHQYREAAASLREALGFRPEWPDAMSHLAWVMATSSGFDAVAHTEALTLAERANTLTGSRDPSILDSLAAAYAALGRFADAIRASEQALSIAARQAPDMRAEIESRLRLYKNGQAVQRIAPVSR